MLTVCWQLTDQGASDQQRAAVRLVCGGTWWTVRSPGCRSGSRIGPGPPVPGRSPRASRASASRSPSPAGQWDPRGRRNSRTRGTTGETHRRSAQPDAFMSGRAAHCHIPARGEPVRSGRPCLPRGGHQPRRRRHSIARHPPEASPTGQQSRMFEGRRVSGARPHRCHSSSAVKPSSQRRRRCAALCSHQGVPRSPRATFARCTRARAARTAASSSSERAERTARRAAMRCLRSRAAMSSGSMGSVARHFRPPMTTKCPSGVWSSRRPEDIRPILPVRFESHQIDWAGWPDRPGAAAAGGFPAAAVVGNQGPPDRVCVREGGGSFRGEQRARPCRSAAGSPACGRRGSRTERVGASGGASLCVRDRGPSIGEDVGV